jgi:hypothetical protein
MSQTMAAKEAPPLAQIVAGTRHAWQAGHKGSQRLGNAPAAPTPFGQPIRRRIGKSRVNEPFSVGKQTLSPGWIRRQIHRGMDANQTSPAPDRREHTAWLHPDFCHAGRLELLIVSSRLSPNAQPPTFGEPYACVFQTD